MHLYNRTLIWSGSFKECNYTVDFFKKYRSFHWVIDDYGLAETPEFLCKSYQYSATFFTGQGPVFL